MNDFDKAGSEQSRSKEYWGVVATGVGSFAALVVIPSYFSQMPEVWRTALTQLAASFFSGSALFLLGHKLIAHIVWMKQKPLVDNIDKKIDHVDSIVTKHMGNTEDRFSELIKESNECTKIMAEYLYPTIKETAHEFLDIHYTDEEAERMRTRLNERQNRSSATNPLARMSRKRAS